MNVPNDEFTLDTICINLDNLSNISVGDKMIIDNKIIMIDNSYVKSVSRWFYGYSRNNIIEFIEKILNESYKHLNLLRKNSDDTSGIMWIKLISRLKKSAVGLTKLRQTYIDDEDFVKKIDDIVKKILKNV